MALRFAASLAIIVLLAGCGRSFPADPDGTLERIRESRLLRVGASHRPPYVVQRAAEDTAPSGREPALVTAYAQHLGARIEWRMDSEAPLMEELAAGELDLVIAGLEDASPWGQEVALTRPYADSVGPDGTPRAHVMALPTGENALLSDLERWLDDHAGGVR